MMRVTALCMLLLLFATSAEGRYRVYHKVSNDAGHQVTLSQARGEFKERLAAVIAGGPAPAPLATGLGEVEVPIRGRKLQQDDERVNEPFILSR